ncbi:MAG: carbohydrate kinase family protein [Clostridia bacterium]|nr:carbohydrate kinase family protein [Clostridia bacterium]
MSAEIVFVGMSLIDVIVQGFDKIPVSASGYRAESCSVNVGGESVNGVLAAAKLGAKTAILCHLGKDAEGDMVVAALEKHGVDVSKIVRDEHPTPVTTMLVEGDGSRKSITNLAHKYNFHPERHLDALEDAKAIVLGSLFRAPFDEPEIVKAVVEYAHKNNILVFADTKIPNFAKIKLEDIKDSLPLIDYITPNEDEGRFFTGEDEPEKMADAFLEYGVKNVIVKLGGKGCLFKNSEQTVRLAAHKIDAVDTTGAGDNFLAAFATEILRGENINDALAFANACGAICSTAVGASTALKDREQVLSFAKTH